MLKQKEDNKTSILAPAKPIVPSERDNQANRLVYKLVRVGDDGRVLPATEDEVMQVESLVEGGSILATSDADASDGGLDNEDNNEASEDKQESSDQDDEKQDSKLPEDLEAERSRLLARLEVLDAMLSKVKTQEQQRSSVERSSGSTDEGDFTFLYSNFSRSSAKYKRQRRPNPKYLSADAGNEFSPGFFHAPNPTREGPTDLLSAGSKTPELLDSGDVHEKMRALSPRTSNRGLSIHTRKRAVMHVTPSLMPKVAIAGEGLVEPKATISLDNLSIRELHEAFRTTFGRETSVKDKHWLKRQISMGMSRLHETTNKDERLGGKGQAPIVQESTLQARVEFPTSAEQPDVQCSYSGANEKGLYGGWVETIHAHSSNRVADCGNDSNGGSLPGVLPLRSFAAYDIAGGNSSVLCKSESDSHLTLTIELKSMEGKRQRKPNKRYLEEEVDGMSPTGNVGTLISTIDSSPLQTSTKRGLRLSSSTIVDNATDVSRLRSLRSSSLYASSHSGISEGSRSKIRSNIQKRKADGRAAKLVKMARSTRIYQHSTDNNVRKAKLKLPSTSGENKNKTLDSYDENMDQGPCFSQTMPDEKHGNMQTEDMEGRLINNSDLVATVPTPNGGTRRKHHRPWTLREVMTLVEGVARCGGGKWADIKKLAFSSVSYRTAVDLKDKWRNLLRASRAQLQSAKQGENRKRHFSVSIPGPILARVRELAALHNQTAGTLVNVTSRSGRIVQRK
ncbi:hypothetical protein O6H91_02G108100 [Diphasiastrum complanatum]|uniref:Uncharacterized protein n=4 Tax=Diphasiastrum complanatum TaxID=34168 RepID=A0ACC2EJ70_DIPCM|nr:hypothetical protein O6H91_02G108100 [Diphasiastrum complanatum]KAJ7566539.1 hypothetical protein O6H91_02G108100 [Diphasiastrum complanatum]KAJ7566540.1 hypothetical protein O6H91_02G108100 [Diphasiastrum complanatum]KAJ7566541.1 hypothetical protein O6H91_02G108100 [Diphasiastrum complanatum]